MSDRMKKSFDININTNVDTEPIKAAERELNDFFDKYESKSLDLGIDKKRLKIDTKDFYKAITATKELDKSIGSVRRSAPMMIKALNADIEFADNVKSEFSEVTAVFNDNSVVHGIDNVISKMQEGFTVVAVDLGERVQYLKQQIADAVSELKNIGAAETSWSGQIFSFSGDDMSESQLEKRIELLKELLQSQQELEVFNGGKFKQGDAPTMMTSQSLSYSIDRLEDQLQQMRDYNLQVEEQYKLTTKQFKRRQALIDSSKEKSWDEYNQSEALKKIDNEDEYDRAISDLKYYIESRRNLIDELRSSENELFRIDGVSHYIENVEAQIEEYENNIKELEVAKKGKQDVPIIGGNLSEVVDQLKEIKKAINAIKTAFEPLTNALSAEDSALHKMLTTSIDDLNTLESRLKEVYQMIDDISKKDFNITQQTVYNTRASASMQSNASLGAYKEKAEALPSVISQLVNVTNQLSYSDGGLFANVINQLNAEGRMSEFFETLNKFDPANFTGKIAGAETNKDIKNIVGKLTVYKNMLLDVANIINSVKPGTIDMSFLSVLDDADEKINKISSGIIDINNLQKDKQPKADNTDKQVADIDLKSEEVVVKFKTLSEQIEAELTSIRSKMEETFDLSTIDPKLKSVKTITDAIYQQFVELQAKINALDLNLEIPAIVAKTDDANKEDFARTNENVGDVSDDTSKEVEGAAESIKQEGNEAEIAAQKKREFIEANKKVAESMITTGEAGKTASDGIQKEAEAVADAYQTIAKFTFNKDKGVNESDLNSFADEIAKNKNLKVKNASLTRGELGHAIGASITFVDPKTQQEIRERYSVRPKADTEDEYELYRSSYTLVENTAKAEQKAANEAERRKKAISDSNKWLIEQANLLAKQENKYKASSGAVKPLSGDTSLINTDTNVVPGVAKTIDGLAESIRSRINDAMGGVITQDFKNEIIKDLNVLENEIQVQQARKYQSTSLRASSIETSRDVFRETVAALEADSKKAGIFDQMAPTIIELKKEVEDFTEDTFVTFLENIKKAQAKFKAEKSKHGQQTQADKMVKAQEDEAWDEYYTQKNAEAEKKRQMELAFSQKEAEEAAEAERVLAQARKEADNWATTETEKELNALYNERGTVITRIIQLSKKLEGLKTTKAKQRAQSQLDVEKDRLAIIDLDLSEYGNLVDSKKVKKQDKRLKNNNIDIDIKREEAQADQAAKMEKQNKQVYDEAIKAQEKLYNLKKKMVELDPQSARGQEMLRKITEAQNDYNKALTETKNLAVGQRESIRSLEAQQESELNALRQEYKSNVSAEQEAKDLEYVLSLYKKYTDAALALKKIQSDTTGAVHTEKEAAAIEDVQSAKAELLGLGIDVNNISESELLTEKQKNAMLEEQVKYKKQIRDIENTSSDKAATKENKQNQNYGKTIYNREQRYFESIGAKERSLDSDAGLSGDFLAKLEKYKAAFKELQDLREQFAKNPDAFNSDALKNQFQETALKVEGLRKEILSTFKEAQKFEQLSASGAILGTTDIDSDRFTDAKSAMIDFAATVTNGQFKLEGFNAAGTEMYGTLDKGGGVVEKVTVALRSGTNQLYAYQSGTKQVSNSWQQLGGELKNGVKQLVGMYFGFHEAIQAVRQGLTYVKAIDLAMTELKKVTDETDATYKNFLKTASSTSAVIGSTVSDFTDATAAFARLGYSIDESSKMAETAIVYKNVADGLDTVEESTESIISTMKAYGIEANDTMGIIDRFNAVGNNFAITSAGIGEAMQRSASALYEGGNSIDESIGLITAANSVIQNPEQVGELLADYKVA